MANYRGADRSGCRVGPDRRETFGVAAEVHNGERQHNARLSSLWPAIFCQGAVGGGGLPTISWKIPVRVYTRTCWIVLDTCARVSRIGSGNRRKLVTAGLFDLRSKLPPLPSTSFRLLSLFLAPRPPVSRLSPPDRHPASPRPCPVGSAAAVSIYPALAAAQPPLHTRPIYRLARLRSTPLALRFRTIRDARLNPHRFARYRIIRAHLRPLLRTDLQQQVNNLFPPFFVPSDRTPR